MVNEWQPSAEEIRSGQEAYIRYLGGVAILNQPDSEFAQSIHRQALTEHDQELIIISAERLMYDGLQHVIAFANPPPRRNMAAAEHKFGAALPHIRRIVDQTYQQRKDRLDTINPGFFALRPAPIEEEPIYHNLCHSRLPKLQTLRLMAGFRPAAFFGDRLDRRTLTEMHRFRGRLNQAS